MTKTMMISRYGDPRVLEWMDIDLPPPGPGEARVRHAAIGVNMLEVGMRQGWYPTPPLPFVPGAEFVGIVEAVGPGVDEVRPGDRVGSIGPQLGSYSEARNWPVARLYPVPIQIPDDIAAACMLKGMTAEFLMTQTYPVAQGTRVLVHAAAGATGLLCVQLAVHLGAEVFAVAGTPEKAAIVAGYGADHALVYGAGDFAERVLAATGGEGVDVVYDSVGKDTFDASLRCLAPTGTFALFGIASGMPPPLELMKLDLLTSQYFVRPSLYAATRTREQLLTLAQATFHDVAHDILDVRIHARYPLREAGAAHAAIESRATSGALVLLP